MATNSYGQEVQATAINPGSFIGTATDENIRSGTIHLLEDGDLTVHFDTGDKVLTDLLAGMDFQAEQTATGITSTADIIIS